MSEVLERVIEALKNREWERLKGVHGLTAKSESIGADRNLRSVTELGKRIATGGELAGLKETLSDEIDVGLFGELSLNTLLVEAGAQDQARPTGGSKDRLTLLVQERDESRIFEGRH